MASAASASGLKLDIQMSWWAMSGIGDPHREWTLEEKFEKIAEAGFTGIQGGIPPADEREKWRRLLDDYGFSFGAGGFPRSPAELAVQLQEAAEFGAAYVSSQVPEPFIVGEEAVELLRGMDEAASRAGIAHFVETHRGRITQDLMRTAGYIDALPSLRLTIDFSHYVLAGEMDGFLPHAEQTAEMYFEKLLKRTSSIHGRISNGQQIQMNSDCMPDDPDVRRFSRWWRIGMSEWAKQAAPETALPFVCELGPTPYAIENFKLPPCPSHRGSDRWKQSLSLKQLAESLWAQAVDH